MARSTATSDRAGGSRSPATRTPRTAGRTAARRRPRRRATPTVPAARPAASRPTAARRAAALPAPPPYAAAARPRPTRTAPRPTTTRRRPRAATPRRSGRARRPPAAAAPAIGRAAISGTNRAARTVTRKVISASKADGARRVRADRADLEPGAQLRHRRDDHRRAGRHRVLRRLRPRPARQRPALPADHHGAVRASSRRSSARRSTGCSTAGAGRWPAPRIGRGVLALIMAAHPTDLLVLYPCALGSLVLSKAYGVVRAAAAPRLVPQGMTLTAANARADDLRARLDARARRPRRRRSSRSPARTAPGLIVTAIGFAACAFFAFRLPKQVDSAASAPRHPQEPVAPAQAGPGAAAAAGCSRWARRGFDPHLVIALQGESVLRLLSGLLTIYLAFYVESTAARARRPRSSSALVDRRGRRRQLRRHRHRHPAADGQAGDDRSSCRRCIAAAGVPDRRADRSTSPFAAVGMLDRAVANALSKIALDALIQRDVVETLRSSAFARSETFLQLAWVVGAAIGVVLPSNSTGDGDLALRRRRRRSSAPSASLIVLRNRAMRHPAQPPDRPRPTTVRQCRRRRPRRCGSWSSPRSRPSATRSRAAPAGRRGARRACSVGGVGPAARGRRDRGRARARRRYDLVLCAGIGGGFAPLARRRHRRRRRRSCSPTSAPRPPTGSSRCRELGFGAERYDVAPKLAVELADRTGGHLGHDPHRRHRHRHGRARPTRCASATPTPSPRAWRAPGVAAAAALHGVRVRRDPRDQQRRRPARPRRLADPARRSTPSAARASAAIVERPVMKLALLALPERHVRLPRLGARAARRRAAARRHVRRHRRHQHRRRARRVRRRQGVLRGAAVAARRLRAAAQRRRARPRLRAAGADPRATSPSLDGRTVAVPSERSTAYLLFRLWAAGPAPGAHRRRAVRRDHAGGARRRATTPGWSSTRRASPTRRTGCSALVDLGEWWEARHRPADPARRDPGPPRPRRRRAGRAPRGRRSSTRGRTRRRRRDYVAAHADEMSPDVQPQHIALYVNEFTRDLGDEGYAAAEALLDRAHAAGLTPAQPAAALTRERAQASRLSANARSRPAILRASARSG